MEELKDITGFGPTGATVDPSPTTGLDQEAFLKIFLAQLEHQDPSEPQDATQMTAQLAQFSQLEQALKSTNALQLISTKLDDLAKAQSGSSALDPISLIGRTVDFGESRAVAGAENVLAFEVTSTASALEIQALDDSGSPLGLEIFAGLEGSAGIAPGRYELHFAGDKPVLKTPSGQELEINFINGDRDAISLLNGSRYRFEVNALVPGSQDTTPVPTTSSGTVSSVNLTPGGTVLSLGDRELNTSAVVRIR